MDALVCGADAIYRALKDRPQLEGKGVKKRIILVSNFLDPVSCPNLAFVSGFLALFLISVKSHTSSCKCHLPS